MKDGKESDLFRLGHIEECIDKIIKLTKILKNIDNFETKWIERDAMIRNFEIIGEASNHISKETKELYSDVNWIEIRGLMNFITHEYFGIDLSNMWVIAINDIPKLKKQIALIISDLENE